MGPFKQIKLSDDAVLGVRRVARKLFGKCFIVTDTAFVSRAKRREFRCALELHEQVCHKLHELTRQRSARSWTRRIDDDFMVRIRYAKGHYQEDIFVITLSSTSIRVVEYRNVYECMVREYTFSTLHSDVERVIKRGARQLGVQKKSSWSEIVTEDMSVEQIYFDLAVIDSLLEEDPNHVEA